MSDEKESALDAVAKPTVEEIVVAGTSAAGAVIGTVTGVGPVVGGVLGAGGGRLGVSAFGRLATAWQDRRKARFAEELDKRIGVGDVPPEGDPAREPFEKKLFLAYMSMMSALDDAALPALARLVAVYTDRGAADGFFKSVGKLIETSDADSLAILGRVSQQLRVYAESLDDSEAGEQVCFDIQSDHDGRVIIAMAWPVHWNYGHSEALPVRDPAAHRWADTYEAVQRAGLVRRTVAAMTYDSPATCYVASIERLNMLARILAGP